MTRAYRAFWAAVGNSFPTWRRRLDALLRRQRRRLFAEHFPALAGLRLPKTICDEPRTRASSPGPAAGRATWASTSPSPPCGRPARFAPGPANGSRSEASSPTCETSLPRRQLRRHLRGNDRAFRGTERAVEEMRVCSSLGRAIVACRTATILPATVVRDHPAGVRPLRLRIRTLVLTTRPPADAGAGRPGSRRGVGDFFIPAG